MTERRFTRHGAIQIDDEGTQLGELNGNGDPLISRLGEFDEWVVVYPLNNSLVRHQLGVTGAGAIDVAVQTATDHLTNVGFSRPHTMFGAETAADLGW